MQHCEYGLLLSEIGTAERKNVQNQHKSIHYLGWGVVVDVVVVVVVMVVVVCVCVWGGCIQKFHQLS
jgi:hypothetical protein